MTAMQRSRILRRAVDILRERNDELAALETLDTGKPLAETRSVDIVTGADVLEYYAGLVPAIEGEQIPLRETSFAPHPPRAAGRGRRHWRLELPGADRPVEIRPGPRCRQRDDLQAQRSHPADCPAGRDLHRGRRAGRRVQRAHRQRTRSRPVADRAPADREDLFTGGTSTGKKVMASASSSSLKEVTMELGGKSPLIIFPDADLDRAADIAVMANFFSSGQVCTNGTRVFIHRPSRPASKPRYWSACSASVSATRRTRTPTSARWSASRTWKACSATSSPAGAEGSPARGGERDRWSAGNGAYVAPTVFTDCRDDMTIVREEIFGPVMSILVYDDEDEAIRRSNDTEYGLAAGVVTQDLARAHRAIHRLEAGICWINTWASRRRKCRSAVTSNPVSVARTVSPPWLITLASSPCKWSWATTPRCSEPSTQRSNP